MIELCGLSTGFPSHPVSENIDLTLEQGGIISLIGPNGCGKTTLLRTIANLQRPVSGQALIDGRPTADFPPKELARKLAFLPQIRSIPGTTVESLVSHGRFPHLQFSRQLTALDKERIARAMELTGVSAMAKKNLQNLSGGERQRVYIAMCVAQDTPYMLWDEPTTYLDIANQYEIMELASLLRREGVTLIMTLHDLGCALSYSDSVCVMDASGRVSPPASPETVYARGDIERIFGVRSKKVVTEGGRVGYYFYSQNTDISYS